MDRPAPAHTTVAHVIGLTGVSRRAFYEQFSNKEECFLATYDMVLLLLFVWLDTHGAGGRPPGAIWLAFLTCSAGGLTITIALLMAAAPGQLSDLQQWWPG